MLIRAGTRHGWATALAISTAAWPSCAIAGEARFAIDIRRTELASALAAFTAQTGYSIGLEGAVPTVSIGPIHGQMTARQALRQILRDTALRAVAVGPRAFRLVARSFGHRADPVAREDQVIPADVIVTGRKQAEALSTVAGGLAVFSPAKLAGVGTNSGSREVAAAIEGLVLTNAGPGRDRPFIRGVADSPFNGFSQSTVSVQLDEGRITYDAAEPGLRLVDVDRVEVLKGPQGPLYGTGALGGVYRIVTNRPVLGTTAGSIAFGLADVSEGGVGTHGEGVLNLPVAADRVAARLVGFAATEAGWIDDVPGREDVNQSLTVGGRLAVRLVPATGWIVDLAGSGQSIRTRDSQYVDSGAEELTRSVLIPEPRVSLLRVAQGTVTGPIGNLSLTAASSRTWQDQTDIYDASAAAVGLGVVGTAAYRDRRSYRVFDQEVRLAGPTGRRATWLIGASYLAATTQARGALTVADAGFSPFFELNRGITETALFADGSMRLGSRLKAAAGLRVFRATVDDERQREEQTQTASKALVGVTPSGSLAFQATPGALLYLRFGSAFRAGGVDPANTLTGRYDADEVRTLDLGGRLRSGGGRLSLDASLFRTAWSHVQSDYLQQDGLPATRNAGDAHIFGAEGAFAWQPAPHWALRGGATWQHARLVANPAGVRLAVDRRLPVTPDFSGRIQVEHSFVLLGRQVAAYAGANFTGATRLSFDDGLDRRTPPFAVARAGATVPFGPATFSLTIDNLLDGRADSFAFGNPFSIRAVRQFTPLRPRTVSVSVARQF